MSATTKLGRVGLVLRGAYDAAAAYSRMDVVTYEGCAYAALRDTTGNAPTDVACWQPLADIRPALEELAGVMESAQSAEQTRASSEAERRAAEKARTDSEDERRAAEQSRVDSEDARQAAEQTRSGNEAVRLDAEQVRADSEAGRKAAEQTRIENEAERQTAESGRERAEEGRAAAEAERADAEQERVTAEQERENAEEQRAQTFAGYQGEIGSLKDDFGNVIDRQDNLWTNGDVVNSYKANAQYQSKYYDIPLDDGEYYIQYENVTGAVAGNIQIFPYEYDRDNITSIIPPSKSGKFSPQNGGVRIYFFSTLTNTSENDGVATWSGIKLVKGTHIVNPSIKESALPDFYKTLPTVIPKIEEDSQKSALFDDIAVIKKTPNLFTHGDISLAFNAGDLWKKVQFDIPLTEGKTYTFKYNNVKNPIENAGIVQIFPYEKDTDIVVSDIYPQEERTFVSPPNGVSIMFWGVMQTSPQENGTTTWSGVELQEGEEIKPEKETVIKDSALPKFIQNVKIAESFEIVSNTFSSGESLALKVSNSKSRNHIGFDATINNMGKITIYYGKDMAFNDCKLTIDSTEVVAYNCTQSWVEMARGNHGLVLSHHISVRIDTGNDKKAVISVTDETGKTYELQTEWVCGHGDVVVENENGSYTKCKLTFYPSEYRQKVWAYGDSYFDLWPWICNAKGASHWMIDGFSGRGSTDALKSLKLALKHATPSIVLWCLGMNDPDTETEISASWLENIKKVKAICDENNITLIPTTIPNVPTRNHSFKNTYVRENFSRYIDISESLGAEVSTSWYNGLLPDGDIHPSDKGRMLIAQKVMSEVPEII